MLPPADLDALRTISHRAQMAYALSCIEAVVRAYDLRGDKYEEWLERAWRRTSAPKSAWRHAPWPRNFAEIDELLDPPVGGWGEGVSDTLGKVIGLARDTCEEILEGRGGATPVRAIVTELARHQIEPPPIAPFLRSPATEANGFGRDVPPAFFREGVDREGFAASLHGALLSDSLSRRREAAYAIANLGVPSDALAASLGETLFDPDHEVCMLSEAALSAIVSSEEFSRILLTTRRLRDLRRIRVALASNVAAERRRAVVGIHDFADLDPTLLELVLRLSRMDSDATVRAAALVNLPMLSLRWRTMTRSIVEALVERLRDESADVRRVASTTLRQVFRADPRPFFDVVVGTVMRDADDRDFFAAASFEIVKAAEAKSAEALASYVIEAARPELDVMLEMLARSRLAVSKVLAFVVRQPRSADTAEHLAEVERRLRILTTPRD